MSVGFLLLRVTASLVVVVVLALLAARLARRSGTGRHSGTDVRVCERVGLTREAAAVVVEVDGRRLLLGVTSGQVSVLADLGADAPSAPMLVAGEPDAEPRLVVPSAAGPAGPRIPTQRTELVGRPAVRIAEPPLSRRAMREVSARRRPLAAPVSRKRLAVPPTQRHRGTGSVLDPRTWQQGLEALRDLTARKP